MPKLNWKLRIDYFQPLEKEDLDLFAPPGEVYRVARSYNTALALYVDGRKEEAMHALAQISSDYPLFPQASHLYGIILAAEAKFSEAESVLERVRLLELADEERRQVEEEYAALRQETQRIRRENATFRGREEVLGSVKKQIALESILTQAPSLGEEEIPMGRIGQQVVWDNPAENRKTYMTIVIVLGLAVLFLLIFFLFWRPEIQRQQAISRERIEKIEWLEDTLQSRAMDNPELALLLSEYQAWLEAGRPMTKKESSSSLAENDRSSLPDKSELEPEKSEE